LLYKFYDLDIDLGEISLHLRLELKDSELLDHGRLVVHDHDVSQSLDEGRISVEFTYPLSYLLLDSSVCYGSLLVELDDSLDIFHADLGAEVR
jgi:hypothetical protein